MTAATPTELNPETPAWTVRDFVAAMALFAFGLMTNLTTVLNNAYSFGSTLFDSAFSQTILWRSGWALKPAPSLDDVSFLNVHLSPINYLPSALSYLIPIDRMSFYGLVFGLVFGLLLVVSFAVLRRQYNGRILPAVIGSVLLYLSGPINNGQWEPHQEYASSLFMVWFFLAWGTGHLRLAVLMVILNAAVREDCGVHLALPLLLLAAHDRWLRRAQDRSADERKTLLLASLSLLLSVAAFVVKRAFFNSRDVMGDVYYGSPPFGHLSAGLLEARLDYTIFHESWLWLPGLVLLAGALWRRDARLLIGWVAFMPYWFFNFFSKGDLNAALGSYKAFPIMVALLWPAILALGRGGAERRALGLVQMAVLIVAVVTWEDGGLRVAAPTGLEGLANRWLLHKETDQAELYRSFESRIEGGNLGNTRASAGVLALYPYSFPIYYRSQVMAGAQAQAEQLDSLLWFAGDRDEAVSEQWLTSGHFPYLYHVIGTRMSLATRLPPDKLPSFAGAIELAVTSANDGGAGRRFRSGFHLLMRTGIR